MSWALAHLPLIYMLACNELFVKSFGVDCAGLSEVVVIDLENKKARVS